MTPKPHPSVELQQQGQELQRLQMQQQLRQMNSAVHYITFSTKIEIPEAEALIALLSKCANANAKEVHLLLSSPGGQVSCGMNLYNVLRAMPYKVTTYNMGNVDSIGNMVYLAGEHRIACPHTTFMFHGVGFNPQPNVRLEEKLLLERLGGIDADQRRIGGIIGERSNLEEEAIQALFLEAQTKNAEWAREAGIVHEIAQVTIPDDVPVHSLVFQRQNGPR